MSRLDTDATGLVRFGMLGTRARPTPAGWVWGSGLGRLDPD